MSELITYPGPKEAMANNDFTVRVRKHGDDEWETLFIYQVKVDMHDVREAAMTYFDMDSPVEVKIEYHKEQIEHIDIRPLAKKINYRQDGQIIRFRLNNPCKLSIEINNNRFRNLHLFANAIEQNVPSRTDANVVLVKPGIHRVPDLLRELKHKRVLYFLPGMHYIEETILSIPSSKTIYIAGGAVVVGSLKCNEVKDVTIRGHGIIYLSDFHRYSAFRGIILTFSKNITIEGITTVDPPHYSIYIGKSEKVSITNFKIFSTRGWSDGIDMMASSDITIDDCFLRTSDDSIAIYGSRWDFYGNSSNIAVSNTVLWADVAHPTMIGTHGDYFGGGDVISDITFENIDILEHHEPQENYWGALAVNASDNNVIKNVHYKDIRIEQIEEGQVFDFRVFFNKKYSPGPGTLIDGITLENIEFNGGHVNPSRIQGYNRERIVKNIQFKNVTINGEQMSQLDEKLIITNEFIENISFE